MSDDKRDDAAWLLARERGQPRPALSEERVARYQQLEALIAELPATPIEPPLGWQERMLAKLDEASGKPAAEPPAGAATTPPRERRAKRRRWVVPAAAAAAAALFVIVMWPRGPGQSPSTDGQIAIRVEPAGSNDGSNGGSIRSSSRGSTRGEPTEHSVGHRLVVEAVVGRDGGELRVYNAAGDMQSSCAAPGPGCHVTFDDDRTTLVLTMTVREPGTYRPVLYRPAPGKRSTGLDDDLSGADKAGLTVTLGEPTPFR